MHGHAESLFCFLFADILCIQKLVLFQHLPGISDKFLALRRQRNTRFGFMENLDFHFFFQGGNRT